MSLDEFGHLSIVLFFSLMIHPWDERCIYLHEWLILLVTVGKYNIHGLYGCLGYIGDEILPSYRGIIS